MLRKYFSENLAKKYVGSHLSLQVIAVDYVLASNLAPYINNNRIFVVPVPYGRGLLNQTILVDGKETHRFSPETDFIKNLPIKNNQKEFLSSIVPNIVGVRKGANGNIAVYDNISAEPDSFNHEPNYNELKRKNNEMDSFMMPKGAVK